MSTINQIKQLAEADTPLLFFQCVLPSGDTQYWSSYTVPFGGNTYYARVLKHDLFDLQLCADDAMDGLTKLSLTLAILRLCRPPESYCKLGEHRAVPGSRR
jgi:hypothetical protein